jgi:hypothetical protein
MVKILDYLSEQLVDIRALRLGEAFSIALHS